MIKVTIEVEVSEKALEMGKKLVNANFNPDDNGKVSTMKDIAAIFAAVCEDNRVDENGKARLIAAQRRLSIAQTNIETGCMFAVKSNFSE